MVECASLWRATNVLYGTGHSENLKTILGPRTFIVAWIIGTACQNLTMIGHVGSDQQVSKTNQCTCWKAGRPLLPNVRLTAHLSRHLPDPSEIVITIYNAWNTSEINNLLTHFNDKETLPGGRGVCLPLITFLVLNHIIWHSTDYDKIVLLLANQNWLIFMYF
jgi:hypothetical protein